MRAPRDRTIVHRTWGLALLLGLVLAGGASAQDRVLEAQTPLLNAYLRIEGIVGGSRHPDFPGWIVAGSVTPHPRQSVQDLSFTKLADKSSPVLNVDLERGMRFGTVLLAVPDPPGSRRYATFELKNVQVTSYEVRAGRRTIGLRFAEKRELPRTRSGPPQAQDALPPLAAGAQHTVSGLLELPVGPIHRGPRSGSGPTPPRAHRGSISAEPRWPASASPTR